MDANDWLMNASGPPAVSWRDRPPGFSVSGVVCDESQVQQQRDPETGESLWWDDGKTQPKMQLVVYIQTDLRDPAVDGDVGVRRLFVKGKSLTEQTREAVKRSGRKGLEVGGRLTVTYVGEGERTSKVKNPPKLYRVEYQPPSDAASAGFLSGGAAPVAQAAPVHAGVAAPSGGFGPPAGQPPAGIDPRAWEALPQPQRAQILATLGGQAAAPPF